MARPRIVLRSSLAPELVIATLRREIDEERWSLLPFSGRAGSQPVVGKMGERRFRLRKRRYVYSDFAGQFYGSVESAPGGSRIEGYFDFPRWVRYLMRAWMALAVVIAIPIFLLTLSDRFSRTHFMNGASPWVGLIVPLVLLLYAFALPAFARWLGRGSERYVLEFMETTLAARRS